MTHGNHLMAFDIIRSWEHIRSGSRTLSWSHQEADEISSQTEGLSAHPNWPTDGGRGELRSSPGKLVWTGGRGWLAAWTHTPPTSRVPNGEALQTALILTDPDNHKRGEQPE